MLPVCPFVVNVRRRWDDVPFEAHVLQIFVPVQLNQDVGEDQNQMQLGRFLLFVNGLCRLRKGSILTTSNLAGRVGRSASEK